MCFFINERVIDVLSTKAKYLKACALFGISKKGLRLIKRLDNLEKLKLDEENELDDEVIDVIVKNCKRLTFLSVCGKYMSSIKILHVYV